ncbi:MAG: AMP-binding protein, partial [Dehalococcoidia bacterium]|nr:AMP-binding protein [Dehalococcoidia bacterium]
MAKLLWEPSEERKRNANMTRFMDLVNRRHGKDFQSYGDFYDWSVENISHFWAAVWDFADIKSSKSYDAVVDDAQKMPGAKWFVGARMNFAENLLRYRDDRTAFIFKAENQVSARMSYRELYDTVARLAQSLRNMGVTAGDRVVAYMPNMIETATAMLAATSIGAVWSSCATDIGPAAALDRLGQVEPKVLFTVDGYYYKGKRFDTLSNAAQIAAGIPSLKRVVVCSYGGEKADVSGIPNAVCYSDFLSQQTGLEIEFEQLPSDHPVYVMFSSGTTGKPKCMVQGGTGVLINHFAEVVIHADLKREDTIMYITTCSWMM